MTKLQMCLVINKVKGYKMTPDVWTKEELQNHLDAIPKQLWTEKG